MVDGGRGWRFIRLVGLFGLLGILASCSNPEEREIQEAFQAYKALFIDNGRVIDTGNGDVSHSEGQGYGLLFAVAANDRTAFDSIWMWTHTVLQRDDKLFHWRYRPCESKNKQCIDDPNNASDGDLLIAWALLRAADKWGDKSYRHDAQVIITAIEEKLFIETEAFLVLLPGEFGFKSDESNDEGIQLNLSYWVFPAIDAITEVSSRALRWKALHRSGTALIYKARFSKHKLPPDWLRVNEGALSLTNTVSQEYGFNACRIPLHLAWAGIDDAAFYSDFERWWDIENTPATVNLLTNEIAEYAMTPGMKAVESAVKHIIDGSPLSLPAIDRNMDYYSASLTLLSMVAVMDAKS